MKHKLKLISLIIIVVLAFTITAACTSDTGTAKFNSDLSQERMMEVINLLSVEDGGRIAGFEGEAASADYIYQQFKSLGLKMNSQEFPITSFSCESVSFETLPSDTINHEVKALSFSAPTPAGGITSEVVPVGMGADDDYKGKDVSGKIALIMRGGEYFRVKTERAYAKGAAAVVFYDPNGDDALAATLTQLSDIPAVSIAREDAEEIETAVGDGNTVEARLIVDSSVRDATSQNVIGIYKSKDNPGEHFAVVGAHYDGVDTPAANDNASGIAVILEIATALSQQEIDLPFDVRFVAFGAEEIGLWGSKAYVSNMSRNDFRNILAMINFDMVGVGEYIELFTVEGTDNDKLLLAAQNVLADMGHTPSIAYTERSDHSPFSYSGVQAIDVQMSPFEHYHTDLDTADMIKPELLDKACELGMGLLVDELPKWIE